MLKIKDEVDLEELKKFGFKEEEDAYVWRNPFNNYMIQVIKDGRNITTRLDTDANDTIYDLITAGLVEKGRGIEWKKKY